ncbi:MAG: hypothetical protein OEU99_16540 [Nitrospira sp.]|nr:hypothetical protein [Nitrospira sp.]
MITSTDGRLNLERALPEPTTPASSAGETSEPPTGTIRTAKELEELERSNILRALDATKWRVSGEQGAANLLGLNASTLSSRMKALKIQKPAAR